ncbi:MAG: sulfotransferase, partial [Candidatus Neomarinimicrobiota bacterium]
MGASEPVFIGGAGRSGTTLIVDMLGQHPRLSPIYETDFVIELCQILFAGQQTDREEAGRQVTAYMDAWSALLPQRPHNKREHERYHHGAHYILFDRSFAMRQTAEFLDGLGKTQPAVGLRGLIEALYAEHCRLDGKPRWVNKTPAYVSVLPTLRTVFPELKFIHCVRDGRDVARSAMTRSWGPDNVPAAAHWWRKIVEQGLEFQQQYPEQCLQVRYEDVVAEPVESLGRMLRWLGEEQDAAELVERYLTGGVRLDRSRVGEWEREMS